MTDNNAVVIPQKHRGGFVKGVSGNPAGRPKNSKNAVTLHKIALEGELRTQLKDEMGEVLKKAIELAKAGDTSMIKLLIDKVISSPRSSDDESAGKERVQIFISQLPGVKPVIQGEIIDGN